MARRIDPPIQCPTCGSPVPTAARFCPVCQRPRSQVEQQLRQAAERTGIAYDELLQRAQAANAHDPQPFIATDDDDGAAEEPSAARSMLRGFVVVGLVGIALVYLLTVATSDDDTALSATDDPTNDRQTSALSESEYTSELQDITGDMSASMGTFAQLASNPRPTDASWKVQVAAEIVVWDSAYRQLQALSPPTRFKAAHTKTLQGLRQFTSAGDDIAAGIDGIDAARIEAGTRKIERGRELIEEANRLMR